MNLKITLSFIMVLIITSGLVPTSVYSESTEDVEFYCYGNTVYGQYPGTDLDEVNVTWDVEDEYGRVVTFNALNEGKIAVDASNLGLVVITQHISKNSEYDSETMRVIPLHLNVGEEVIVKFIDDSDVISTTILRSTTVVRFGDNHVEYPNLPDRIGETFMGWFIDEDLTIPFDPKKPILEDTNVYSKWMTTAQSGGSVVLGNDKIVTFHTVPGLDYSVIEKGDDSITFGVSIENGYIFKDGSVTVTANGAIVDGDDGSYKVTCLTDTDIMITGNRLYTMAYNLSNVSISVNGFEEPPDLFPEGGFNAIVSVMDDYEGLRISVYSDGRDITSMCVDGESINILSSSGNILIVASAFPMDSDDGFPWWIIVVAILIVGIIAFLIARNREPEDLE